MARKQKWSELSPGQQTAILTMASLEMALTVTAAVDLWRRPDVQVRGSKGLWAAALILQPFGPVAYLTVGVRRKG